MAKLEATVNKGPVVPKKKKQDKEAPLEPEAYSEEGAKGEISLTEKELNALIANNPEVAQRVAIDLSENLISVKLVVPMRFMVTLYPRINLKPSLDLDHLFSITIGDR